MISKKIAIPLLLIGVANFTNPVFSQEAPTTQQALFGHSRDGGWSETNCIQLVRSIGASLANQIRMIHPALFIQSLNEFKENGADLKNWSQDHFATLFENIRINRTERSIGTGPDGEPSFRLYFYGSDPDGTQWIGVTKDFVDRFSNIPTSGESDYTLDVKKSIALGFLHESAHLLGLHGEEIPEKFSATMGSLILSGIPLLSGDKAKPVPMEKIIRRNLVSAEDDPRIFEDIQLRRYLLEVAYIHFVLGTDDISLGASSAAREKTNDLVKAIGSPVFLLDEEIDLTRNGNTDQILSVVVFRSGQYTQIAFRSTRYGRGLSRISGLEKLSNFRSYQHGGAETYVSYKSYRGIIQDARTNDPKECKKSVPYKKWKAWEFNHHSYDAPFFPLVNGKSISQNPCLNLK